MWSWVAGLPVSGFKAGLAIGVFSDLNLDAGVTKAFDNVERSVVALAQRCLFRQFGIHLCGSLCGWWHVIWHSSVGFGLGRWAVGYGLDPVPEFGL